MSTETNLLKKALKKNKESYSDIWIYIGYIISLLIMIFSVHAYLSFKDLFYSEKNSETYIISKNVSFLNSIKLSSSKFTTHEISEIKSLDFITDAEGMVSNRFKIEAKAGTLTPYYTELFFESADKRFLDKIPADWEWNEDDKIIPIIVSSSFLHLYNFGFALSQGYPQISKSAAKLVPIDVYISGNGKSMKLKGKIKGFSDKIQSILVPMSFIKWANKNYGEEENSSSRVIVKIKSMNLRDLEEFVKRKNYVLNNEVFNFSTITAVINSVFYALLFIGLFIFILTIIILSGNIRLAVQYSGYEIKVLTYLGKGTKDIKKVFEKKLIWINFISVVFVMIIFRILIYTAARDLGRFSILEFSSVSIYTYLVPLFFVFFSFMFFNFVFYREIRIIS